MQASFGVFTSHMGSLQMLYCGDVTVPAVGARRAGKLLGGLVSIVGVGTLALFSGVITVGFLEQLKTSREQRATVLGMASATAQAPAAAISRETCPHCGHQLSLDLIEPGKS
jgi:hypothetical protein